MLNALERANVWGDGVQDDTAGLQAALDSAASVYLPCPPGAYLISRPLALHSYQTLSADRHAMIRLADHAHAHMLTNADPETGNTGIVVTGGIWDGNNAHQTCEYHSNGGQWRLPYDRARYLGVLLQFDRVTDLRVAHMTLKDPETFGLQAARLRRFTIEDITFDYNLLTLNMDGVHLHGHCHQGRIANLKGTTNDDLVALNADDGWMYEMCRGPITDILVDGIWADDGYTAVRLLSAGSPIRRVRLANIYGSYRYNVVSFTNHKVHPGEPSTFDEISITGVHCRKSVVGMAPVGPEGPSPHLAPFWIDAPARVSSLTLRDYHRSESALPVADIEIERGATIESLQLSDITLTNGCGAPIDLIHNRGTISNLAMLNVQARSGGGRLLRNEGYLERLQAANIQLDGLEPEL